MFIIDFSADIVNLGVLNTNREGENIESGGHYTVEVKERHAVLIIRDGSRLDSGPYRITAKNK